MLKFALILKRNAMQDLPPKISGLITDQLSLHELTQSRSACAFFASNFTQSYLVKLLHFIRQKSVLQVAQGHKFDLILAKDGTVYSRGDNPLVP